MDQHEHLQQAKNATAALKRHTLKDKPVVEQLDPGNLNPLEYLPMHHMTDNVNWEVKRRSSNSLCMVMGFWRIAPLGECTCYMFEQRNPKRRALPQKIWILTTASSKETTCNRISCKDDVVQDVLVSGWSMLEMSWRRATNFGNSLLSG